MFLKIKKCIHEYYDTVTYMLINSDINEEKSGQKTHKLWRHLNQVDGSSWQRDSYRRDHVRVGKGDTETLQDSTGSVFFSGDDSPSGLICLTQQTYKYANCLIGLERSGTSSW